MFLNSFITFTISLNVTFIKTDPQIVINFFKYKIFIFWWHHFEKYSLMDYFLIVQVKYPAHLKSEEVYDN